MDLLRLPSPLRRALLDQRFVAFSSLRQRLSTVSSTQHADKHAKDSHASNALSIHKSSPDKLRSDKIDSKREERKIKSSQNPVRTLTSTTLNDYNTTNPPDGLQLKSAASYFHRHEPAVLFSSPVFRTLPPSSLPEVAFLGRSNVGKSSLLNALFGRPNVKVAHVSTKPGRTRTMNGYGIGNPPPVTKGADKWKAYARGGLVVVDMPGYGSGSQAQWGPEILKYLENRKQLRRTYVLIDTEHGLKQSDIQLLLHLRKAGVAHQLVLSKVDKLLYPSHRILTPAQLQIRLGRLQQLREKVMGQLEGEAKKVGLSSGGISGDVLCCSARKSILEKGLWIGVNELRWAVLTACGLEDVAASRVREKNANHGVRRLNL